jgi:hypothetical protein
MCDLFEDNESDVKSYRFLFMAIRQETRHIRSAIMATSGLLRFGDPVRNWTGLLVCEILYLRLAGI